MKEVFGSQDEPSYELEIYDSVNNHEDAEFAIKLFQSHVRDGVLPEQAKEMVLTDGQGAIISLEI